MLDSPDIQLSVLIPNYNYGRYIGETIESVLHQGTSSTEVVVTDNASTDDSVQVVKSIGDSRVRLAVNECNVGFSANLERVAAMARGRRMILLSSDDRMREGALAAYARLEAALDERASSAVWGAVSTKIDANGAIIGELLPDPKLWRDAHHNEALSAAVGYPVRSMPAAKMLRRSLELLRSPLAFATTCYPRALHDAIGGYTGGRIINPDKWFLWKLMSVAETIHVIEHPLFDYRVHDAGQGPQEKRSGALKHLTDEYAATFSLPDAMLARAGLTRDDLARAFIEHDIALRGLLALADGQRATARRSVHFGAAAYPRQLRENPKAWALRLLLALGPVGSRLAKLGRDRLRKEWAARESRRS